MHKIESDNVFRGPTDAMHFDMRVQAIHTLAEMLEEQGFETHGSNENLFCYLHDAKKVNVHNLDEGIVLKPQLATLDSYGKTRNMQDLIVRIPDLGISVQTTVKDFKKIFDNNSIVVKAIKEYKSSLAQLRKTMHDNISMAVTLAEI